VTLNGQITAREDGEGQARAASVTWHAATFTTRDHSHPSHATDMGVKHSCMGWDVGILFDWFKGNGAKLRAMMGA